MTDPVPSSYRERIRSLESELDRSVCGYPTGDGVPCRQWPVDEDGRCTRHQGKNLRDAFQSGTVSRKPQSTTSRENHPQPPLRDPRNWRYTLMELARRPIYWVCVFLFGLVTGTAYGTLDKGMRSEIISSVEESRSIDVENPDFNQIHEWFRSGRQTAVRRELNKIYEKSSSKSARARALYYRYVLEQKLGNHRASLSDAESFLQEFDEHTLRPEVLFGAWFLSHRFLDQPGQAQQYEEQLRSEYPESKWAKKINS